MVRRRVLRAELGKRISIERAAFAEQVVSVIGLSKEYSASVEEKILVHRIQTVNHTVAFSSLGLNTTHIDLRVIVAMRLPPLTLLTPNSSPASLLFNSRTTIGDCSSKSLGVIRGGLRRAPLSKKNDRKKAISMSIYIISISQGLVRSFPQDALTSNIIGGMWYFSKANERLTWSPISFLFIEQFPMSLLAFGFAAVLAFFAGLYASSVTSIGEEPRFASLDLFARTQWNVLAFFDGGIVDVLSSFFE